jgi:hypothetical protein
LHSRTAKAAVLADATSVPENPLDSFAGLAASGRADGRPMPPLAYCAADAEIVENITKRLIRAVPESYSGALCGRAGFVMKCFAFFLSCPSFA